MLWVRSLSLAWGVYFALITQVAAQEPLPIGDEVLREMVNQRVEALARERLETLPGNTRLGDSSNLDVGQVNRGRAAFARACTTCHDAQRSLSTRKSPEGWRATVSRMAAKDGATIAPGDVGAIAAYLASNSNSFSDPLDVTPASTSLFATLSPVWRGNDGEHELESPDFFVDAWVGADWQPGGKVTGRVVACTSCHAGQNNSQGFTLELVEASATLDLLKWLQCSGVPHLRATLKAGRLLVPFGAFSSMSYPGVYKTVSNPLMFNMGRRVGPTRPLQPVLPAPFADEGVNLHLELNAWDCWTLSSDFYAINGLQGASPRLFNDSRRYVDNNRQPSIGGRLTLDNQRLRLGASIVTGNQADDGEPAIQYKLAGVDAVYRIAEQLQFYFEYAIRHEESLGFAGQDNYTYGVVCELDLSLASWLEVVLRFDTLEQRNLDFGDDSQERFTYGLNLSVASGGTLAINHEHWMFRDGSDSDVLGIRWTSTF